jgi:urea transporter
VASVLTVHWIVHSWWSLRFSLTFISVGITCCFIFYIEEWKVELTSLSHPFYNYIEDCERNIFIGSNIVHLLLIGISQIITEMWTHPVCRISAMVSMHVVLCLGISWRTKQYRTVGIVPKFN